MYLSVKYQFCPFLKPLLQKLKTDRFFLFPKIQYKLYSPIVVIAKHRPVIGHLSIGLRANPQRILNLLLAMNDIEG